MMLIATVTNDLNYDQRMQRICSSLCQNGYEVLLLGRVKKNSNHLSHKPFKQKRLKCFFEKGKIFYLEFNIRLFFFLLKSKFDILYTVDSDTMPGGAMAAMIKGKKRVLDAHELFADVPELDGREFSKSVWRFLEKIFYPKYHLHLSVSEGVSQILSQRHNIDFYTIRNVPMKRSFSNKVAGNNKYILYQGALNMGRGLEELIEAAKSIDVQIKLAGEGDLSQKLRDLCKKEEVKNVEFLGYKFPEELNVITASAAIGLNLLSENSVNYYYSLANKFFDYVQAGVPSINMNYPEYRALNEQYEVALLIDDIRPETIADSVNILLKDRELYVNMQRNCRLAAEEWNWESEEKKLLQIFDRLGG